jgi:hypothetical protein
MEIAAELAELARGRVEACKIAHPASEITSVVTLSLGLASVVPEHGRDPATLVAAADVSLYRAKAKGRNRVEHGDVGRTPGSELNGATSVRELAERFPDGLPAGTKFLGFKSQLTEPEK